MALHDKLISCSGISKRFGNAVIFDDMNIDIESNQIIGLVGDNGSGKTSFIKLISGMLLPDKGKICIFDTEIKNERNIIALKDKISILGDANRSLYWNLSGRDNLFYFWTIKTGMNRKTGLSFIEELIIKFNMSDFIDKRVESYSKGMKQRLLLAVAMLGYPKLLIMDEPLNGLDYDNTLILKKYISDFVRKNDGTVILTSHDSRFINEVCDTKFIIKDKRIEGMMNVGKSLSNLELYYRCTKKEADYFSQYSKERKEGGIFKVEAEIHDQHFYKELAMLIEEEGIEVIDIREALQ